MALIVMVTYDNEVNKRDEYTKLTLQSLLQTVDFNKHRLFISDNGSYEPTQQIFGDFIYQYKYEYNFPWQNLIISYNEENLGTSKALNKGLEIRLPNEPCIKIDPDMVIHQNGWVDSLCEVIERDPQYGIVGLKRKDLEQTPNNDNLTFRTEMVMLPHERGQSWITVEESNDIIGSCTLFNPLLMDAIGLSYQPSLYGFEDNLYSLRSLIAGFKNCFLPHIICDHIDRGDNEYAKIKHTQANDVWAEYQRVHTEYVNGIRPIYYDGR